MMQQHLSESTSVILRAVPRPRPRLHALPPAASAAPRLAPPLSVDPLAALGGLYTAPFGFVVHPLVNQRARCVPLVLDSAADLKALSRALALVAAEGGFDARIRGVWLLEERPSVRISSKSVERVCVSCHISRDRLLASALSPADGERRPRSTRAIDRAAAALAVGARDVAIASAHNAMIEHAIAAVALALGSAPGRVTRAVEQHAMRWGRCAPICNWRVRDDIVEGELELPLDIPTHGRRRVDSPNADSSRDSVTTAPHREFDPSRDIAVLAACIGMAASLIALEDAVRARALEPHGSAPPPRRRPVARVRTSLPPPLVGCGRPERKARPLSAKPPSSHPAASSPASRRRGSTTPPRAR
jgi:hypothetical protein